MQEILSAAAVVFARSGYEAATTNAIAAEAGISPGSLYQFFANKEAIARALADRFVSELRDAHRKAFTDLNPAACPLPELLDRVIDPIVAFNLANPGFKALFARPDMPAGLAEAAKPIQEALLARVEAIVSAHIPALEPEDRARVTRLLIQVFQAAVPLIIAEPEATRPLLLAELKRMIAAYLTQR
jgi:AcrR family transcriptional regulator